MEKSSQYYNQTILIGPLRLKRYKNTKIYFRDDLVVFSPVIKKNSYGSYWFDIRQANLNNIKELAPSKKIFLARIVPEKFVLAGFSDIKNITNYLPCDRNNKSGEAWGFIINFQTEHIQSKKDKSFKVNCVIVEPSNIISSFNNMVMGK